MTRTGKPGGWSASVGAASCCRTISSPLRPIVSCAASRMARATFILTVGPAFQADVQDRGKACGEEDATPMIVDAVLQAGRASPVSAGRAFQQQMERPSGRMRRVQTKKQTALAGYDAAVVFSQQARALRDQQVSPGRAVVDVSSHLGRDLAGQVGAQAGDQGRPGSPFRPAGCRGWAAAPCAAHWRVSVSRDG